MILHLIYSYVSFLLLSLQSNDEVVYVLLNKLYHKNRDLKSFLLYKINQGRLLLLLQIHYCLLILHLLVDLMILILLMNEIYVIVNLLIGLLMSLNQEIFLFYSLFLIWILLFFLLIFFLLFL